MDWNMRIGNSLPEEEWFDRVAIKQAVKDIIKGRVWVALAPLFLYGLIVGGVVFGIMIYAMFILFFIGFGMTPLLGEMAEVGTPGLYITNFLMSLLGTFLFMCLVKYYMALVRDPDQVAEIGILKTCWYAISDGFRVRLGYACWLTIANLLLSLVIQAVSNLVSGIFYIPLISSGIDLSNWVGEIGTWSVLLQIVIGVVAFIFIVRVHLAMIPAVFIMQDTATQANTLKRLSFIDCLQKSWQLMKGRHGEMFVFLMSLIGWNLLIITISLLLPFLIFDPNIGIMLMVILVPVLILAFCLLFPYQLMSVALWVDHVTMDDPDIVDFGE